MQDACKSVYYFPLETCGAFKHNYVDFSYGQGGFSNRLRNPMLCEKISIFFNQEKIELA